jgi:hypothetical protein
MDSKTMYKGPRKVAAFATYLTSAIGDKIEEGSLDPCLPAMVFAKSISREPAELKDQGQMMKLTHLLACHAR